jgi:hypothetical protein
MLRIRVGAEKLLLTSASGQVLSKFVGQSEENVRGLFAGTPLTLLALLVQKYKIRRPQGAAFAEARAEEEEQGDESSLRCLLLSSLALLVQRYKY